jgi:hypothetical protein
MRRVMSALFFSAVLAVSVGYAQAPAMKIATPEDLDKAMKAIGPAFGATNKAVQSGALADARTSLATARSTMAGVPAFWAGYKKDEQVALAKDSLAKMDELDKVLAAGDAAAAPAAAKAVGGTCAACHTKFREQDPTTKLFSIKPGTL